MIQSEGHRHAGLFGNPSEFAQTVVEHGTIGWDDGSDRFDLGTADNGGVTFIKVQLFRGSDPATPDPGDGRAHGYKLRARLSGFPFWVVPPDKMQCFVAFPGGFSETPGVGIIFGLPGQNPKVQFSDTRAVMDLTGYRLIIRADAIALQTTSGHFLSLSDDAGIQAVTKTGDGINIEAGEFKAFASSGGDAKSVLLLNAGEASLMQKGGSFITCKGANSTWMGTKLSIAGGSVLLGAHAAAATPVAIIALGVPGPSTSIFGQA